MNGRWKGLLNLAGMFSGLVVFWGTMALFGLKPAIAATLVFVALDGARRLLFRLPTPRLYLLSNLMAVVFGIVDLSVKTPFMIRYEPVITNLIVAGVFAQGAMGARPMLIEIVEQQRGEPFPPGAPGIVGFFRAFTLAWALFFVARAGFNLWLAETMPLTQALAVRAVVGNVSMLVMAAISFQGRRIFEVCRKLGLFKSPPAPSPAREEPA